MDSVNLILLIIGTLAEVYVLLFIFKHECFEETIALAFFGFALIVSTFCYNEIIGNLWRKIEDGADIMLSLSITLLAPLLIRTFVGIKRWIQKEQAHEQEKTKSTNDAILYTEELKQAKSGLVGSKKFYSFKDFMESNFEK